MLNQQTKRFKRAFVVQQTPHDLQGLRDYAERIETIFLASQDEGTMLRVATEVLADFDPVLDVIVPVGTVLANIVVGNVLGMIVTGEYCVALFTAKQYHITVVNLDVKELADGKETKGS